MRSILVPVADRPECAVALESAFNIAEALSANVTGLHIRPHKLEAKKRAIDVGRGWPQFGDIFAQLTEEEVQLNSKAAAKLFKDLAEQNGFHRSKSLKGRPEGGQAMWREVVGGVQPELAIFGPLADLIVVSRPRSLRSKKAQAFLMSALMASCRPVLMLPHQRARSLGKHVMVAWNQSVEAAAVLHASLPLLEKAESVRLYCAGPENRLGPKSSAVAKYLRQYNIRADIVRTPGNHVEKELEAAYTKQGCDLLMMGAYSRHHWRERVFGGLTDHVLNKMKIPTLMMHR